MLQSMGSQRVEQGDFNNNKQWPEGGDAGELSIPENNEDNEATPQGVWGQVNVSRNRQLQLSSK